MKHERDQDHRGSTPRENEIARDATPARNAPPSRRSNMSHGADSTPSHSDRGYLQPPAPGHEPLIDGVRTIETPPGEPYKDIHLRRD